MTLPYPMVPQFPLPTHMYVSERPLPKNPHKTAPHYYINVPHNSTQSHGTCIYCTGCRPKTFYFFAHLPSRRQATRAAAAAAALSSNRLRTARTHSPSLKTSAVPAVPAGRQLAESFTWEADQEEKRHAPCLHGTAYETRSTYATAVHNLLLWLRKARGIL